MTQNDAAEDRLIQLLAAEGLINRSRRAGGSGVRLAVVAAMLTAAFWLGAIWPHAPQGPTPHGQRYALLLYEGRGYRSDAPGHTSGRAAEYGAWARAAHRDGRVVSGEELQAQAGVIGPIEPGHLQPAGFFIVETVDRGAALRLARTCPHLKYGGTVVVRALDQGAGEQAGLPIESRR